jgi:atypical dual specificity phosphatase
VAHYWVIDDILAGRPGPRCVPWNTWDLFENGFRGIVSLDAGVDPKAIEQVGIHHLPAYAPMNYIETEEEHLEFLAGIPKIVQFIDEHRERGEATLVHCHYGCDRTGCVLGCYLVARENMDPYEAFQHIKTQNSNAFGISGYAEAIITFHKLIQQYPEWLNQTT